MSSPRSVRRADKVMSEAAAREMLAGGFAGRLGTVGPDGWPYVVPLLYSISKDGPPGEAGGAGEFAA